MKAKKLFVLVVSIAVLVTTLGFAAAQSRSSGTAGLWGENGTVKSVSQNSITIQTASGATKTFTLASSADTGIRNKMKTLKTGDKIKVFTQAQGKNELRAIIDEN